MGRDAVFSGTANEFPSKTAPYNGNWIFQAKHRTTKTKTTAQVEKELLKSLGKELSKIFIKHQFQCDHYIYITNLNVTNSFREEARTLFTGFCAANDLQAKTLDVIEYKDFDVFISNNLSVRFSFPSLLTFTDLEKVFLKKEDIKNKGYLKSAQQRIDRFVSTNLYIEAVGRINANNLLMLVGNPKSGKTSMVEALALCYLNDDRFKPYFIKNTDEFFTISAYLPQDECALFICDDIFGVHELDPNKLAEWTDYFQSVMGLIESNRKFIFTTRQYIYEQFASRSGLRAFFPEENDPSRYIVKLKDITYDEREQILNKHLLLSNLSRHKKELVQAATEEILSCKDFSPEVIRSLIPIIYNAKPSDVPQQITKHIKDPNEYLYKFFNNISVDKRLLLISIAVSLGPEIDNVEDSFLTLLNDSGIHPSIIFGDFIDELDGSIVNRRDYLELSEIEYYHPSMFDVIIGVCKKDQHYRQLMLKNVNLEMINIITLLRPREGSNKVQISNNDIATLTEGIERMIMKEKLLLNILRLIQWIGIWAREVASDPTIFKQFAEMKSKTRARCALYSFYEMHSDATLLQWVDLLNQWNVITGKDTVEYAEELEALHRNHNSFDYWRLVFLLENINEGFMNKVIPALIQKRFTERIAEMARGLRERLYLSQGRPKTPEIWMPMFREVEDLITKMKKSGRGRRIIDTVHDDWSQVMRFSQFAKNRHSGMIKAGHWKTYKRLRNYSSIGIQV
jgi:hypothetical protein